SRSLDVSLTGARGCYAKRFWWFGMLKQGGKWGVIRPRTSREPLHSIVRNALQGRIASGVYKSGEALPSVPALAAEFDVSAITIKRAFRDLQLAGMLQSYPGL